MSLRAYLTIVVVWCTMGSKEEKSMSYDYEYDRMVNDSDELYDLYTESVDDDYEDYYDGYDHYEDEYQDYYFNVADEIVDDDDN